jgi:ATP-dependent RNA helicase DHX57
VPQFVLEEAIGDGKGSDVNMICTQPRRLPAIALANRVSDEMCVTCGDLVGYSIRLEKKSSKSTRLLFCTTGILLRRLTSDRELADVSHVVIDEVHERSLDSDLLMLLLREVLETNKRIKLVLMSATADAELFATYFEKALGKNGRSLVSIVDIPGFTYPVRVLSLEDAIQIAKDAGLCYCKLFCMGVWTMRGNDECLQSSCCISHELDVASGMNITLRDAKRKQVDHDKRQNKLLKLAADAGSEYDASVVAEVAKTDENVIDYDAIEAAITLVLAAEARDGPWAMLDDWDEFDTSAYGTVALQGHGAIMVFLPGSLEIAKLQRQLQASSDLREVLGACKAEVLPLHGGLSPADQQRVFRRYPRDKRKIILATNIAETSVTIDDVTIVIDSGKMKEIQMDKSSGISRLAETWVSQAAAKQRKGRAGRVRYVPATVHR